jgi:phosphatidylglycerophosphate synthase
MKYTRADILTPANAITLFGLILVLVGCFYLDSWTGIILVVLGRSMDLIDGPVARATNTTKFSVFWDPTADKIALLGILVSVMHFSLAPLPIVLYILVQNGAVAYLSIKAERQNKAVGALISGKLNLFFQNCAIVLFIVANLVSHDWATLYRILAYSSFFISVPFSFIATRSYADLLEKK